MNNIEIENYIKKRYDRWLDYAKFHTVQAGLPGEEVDVLNEVLFSLLKKDETKLLEMLNAKKNQYRELDFFVLNMVKMNATSPTAPYKAKNKPIPVNANVNYQNLEIEDIKADEPDKSAEYLEKYRDVCRVVERLDLSRSEKEIFKIAFVVGDPVSSFCNNSKKTAFTHYFSIKTAITVILFQEGKTKVFPKVKIMGRAKQLIFNYNLTKTY